MRDFQVDDALGDEAILKSVV